MSGPLWAAFGISLGAAILNGVLGLTRPLSRTYLSFAWIMAFVAAYLYLENVLYAGASSSESVEIIRLEVLAAHGFLAGIIVFVPAYTHVRWPRWLRGAAWTLLGVFFFINLVSAYGVWFSGPPLVVPSTFLDEIYFAVVAPSIGPLQYAHAAYVVGIGVIAIACAGKVILRGERQRGVAMVLSLALVVLHHVADVVRDEIGASWPYVAEFGLVSWGVIMTIQLAIDYREVEDGLRSALARVEEQTAELTDAIDLTVHVRDRLNTPLQTLELGLAIQPAERGEERAIVDDLRGAVRKLTALGRRVASTAARKDAEASR